MGAGAPFENSNAEKWTIEEAEAFLSKAIEISQEKDYDFIGEVAKKQGSYIDVYDYLVDKFPNLGEYKTTIKRNCEVNCFSNGKKGGIVPSMAIMNLKSNHGWTDRADFTTKSEKITSNIDYTKLSTQALKEIADATTESE